MKRTARPSTGCWPSSTSPHEVVEAARQVHEAGYRRSTPTRPIRSRSCRRPCDLHHSPLPQLVLVGRDRRAASPGYGLEYWASVIEYPMNIGGRPFHSWPAFIVPDLRDHDPLRRGHGVLGHAGPERPARALPPGLQRPGFALRRRDKFFIVHRGARPEVRPRRRRGASSTSLGAARGLGGRALMRRARSAGARRSACAAARRPAAGRTCTTSPSTSRCATSDFFGDERSARPLVEGTVARGQLREDDASLHGQGRRRRSSTTLPVAGHRRRSCSAARTRFQHLLHALPRPHRPRRRHGRAARLQAAALVPHRPPARRRRSATSST